MIEQRCSNGFDPFVRAGNLVRTEVVHDHRVPGLRLWTEDMVEVCEEDLGIGGRLVGHGGDHAAYAHCAQSGR